VGRSIRKRQHLPDRPGHPDDYDALTLNPMQAPNMNAVALRFYVHQPRKHGKELLFEWLLARAKELGIHGGSAFFAAAGYGRHGVIHEQRFFELPEVLPVMVEFIVTPEEADKLLDLVRTEKIHTFCTRTPTEVFITDA
jgi:PII-like signaling protein